MATSPVSQPVSSTASRPPEASAGPNGWAVFAGIVLCINGGLNMLYGLAALLNDKVVTVGGGQGVAIWDFTAWGWVMLVVGGVLVLTGIGLLAGNGAARWAGIAFASISALATFGVMSAFPIWAIMVIALDIIVIYQLAANWERAA